MLAAIAVIVALNQLFYRTALGRAFRAVSDEPADRAIDGHRQPQIFALAMGIALAVAALAGLFLGIRANFDPTIGPSRLIFAFEAVIIGGLGSLWGTLAGGIVIGIAQTVGAAINPEWQILAGHLAFLRRAGHPPARPVPAGAGVRGGAKRQQKSCHSSEGWNPPRRSIRRRAGPSPWNDNF